MPRDDLRAVAAMMVRRAQLASLLLLGCVSAAIAADKAAELSDEFLEYLGSFEGEDESWMDLVAASAASSESAKPQAQASKTGSDAKVVANASSSASSQGQAKPQTASVTPGAVPTTGKVEK